MDVPESEAQPGRPAMNLLFRLVVNNVSQHYFWDFGFPETITVEFDALIVNSIHQLVVVF